MSEKLTLLQRINAVQREVDYVQKEKKQGMRYSIVSHDAVTAKVRPLMVKHGVLYYPIEMEMEQVGNRTQTRMAVRFVSIDDAKDFIDVLTAGYGIDDQDKGPGKAISYSVKYALLKCLGLESGDDPDQDQNVTHRDEMPPIEQVRAKEPPRKANGKPEVGWREDGTRTSHSLHQDKDWPEFEREVLEARSVTELTKIAFAWSALADQKDWNHEYRTNAKQYINDRKEWLLKQPAPDDDIFPGDLPSQYGNGSTILAGG
jgi:hypothetical protein